MPPRIKALFLLALALVRAIFHRLVSRGAGGLARFQSNYASDGLSPVSSAQRAAMAGFGRCIACGLCDRGEAERMDRSNGAYRGVMELMLAGSRSMPDFGAAAIGFDHVPDDVLAEKEAICPTGVPMREIAAFVRENAPTSRRSLVR